MQRPISWKTIPWLWGSTLALVTFVCLAFLSTITAANTQQLSPSTRRLPGEEIWKQGVSSFLFGTNDTYEWSPQNIETQPAIQNALRAAGFTLLRSFFKDQANKASIDQRIKTIEQSGAHCLGVITNIFDIPYDEYLVQYLGNRCLLYEFGNEPDYNGIPADSYLKQWNRVIPLLRHINPSANFIGPVLSDANVSYLETFLAGVEASNVLPDAVSFHWYSCYQNAEADCLNKVSSVGQAAREVRWLVKNILGQDIPVGITEWNFDPGNPPPAYGDERHFITQYTTQTLQSMMKAGVSFACQFDAASFAGYGHLDMFDQKGNPRPQYDVLKTMISIYQPS